MTGDNHATSGAQQPHASLEAFDGESVVALSEPSSGSTVYIVPAIGSNVFRFVTRVAGRSVEVLATPPDLETLRKLPTRWGAGVLFPYPGRVRDDGFEFQGTTVRLLADPDTGNAMHGVVRRRKWRVLDMGASPSLGAWVQTALNSIQDGISPQEWPYPFTISLKIQLLDGRLRTEVSIRNEGDKAMPFGLAFHPYFPTPLGQGGSQEQCEVTIPADERWTDLIEPRAKVVPIGPADWPRRPLPIGDIEVNLTTTHGVIRNHWFRFHAQDSRLPRLLGRVVDPENQVELSVLASQEFSASVFYTPPGLSTASIEPHTGMPNAFNLAGAGRPDPGLEVLEAGREWTAWYEIAASALKGGIAESETG
ncbi:MAG: aldose 1-epimerase [Pseudomonadota bacterium]